MNGIDGILVIHKEKGLTSREVVDKVRKLVGNNKIGHTGTLDPDAEGVLPVCIGNSTKVVEYLTDKDKEYVVTMKFGIVTDTQDISGKVLSEKKDVKLDKEETKKAIMGFLGDYMQTPPIYSAVKVKGKKLYEYARNGETVKIPSRKVVIKNIDILDIGEDDAKIKVLCTKGTYMRTLCHDIGKKLKCGACMTELTRTKSGTFVLEDAVKLKELENIIKNGKLEELIMKPDVVFEEYKKLTVKEDSIKKLVNGNKLYLSDISGENTKIEEKMYTIYNRKKFYALYKGVKEDEGYVLKVLKMFVGGENE